MAKTTAEERDDLTFCHEEQLATIRKLREKLDAANQALSDAGKASGHYITDLLAELAQAHAEAAVMVRTLALVDQGWSYCELCHRELTRDDVGLHSEECPVQQALSVNLAEQGRKLLEVVALARLVAVRCSHLDDLRNALAALDSETAQEKRDDQEESETRT